MTDPNRTPLPGPSRPGVRVLQRDTDEIGVFEVLNMLLRRRRMLVGAPLVTGILVAAITLMISPTYRASTALVPESRAQSRLPAGLSGIAGQLGLSLGGDASQSPRFYGEVVRSRGMLERMVQSRFADPRTPEPGDSATLMVLLGRGGRDHVDSVYQAARRLQNLVEVRVDNTTNIIRVFVDSRYPELAAAVGNRFVTYLNDFNAQVRQSQARERRRFSEERVKEVADSLATAEHRLRDFRDRNRHWQESAALVLQEASLRRQLTVQQEVYLTLRREYESARIDEVNETPVLTVIDSAAVPQRKVKPARALIVLIAMAFIGLIAVFVALAQGFAQRAGQGSTDDYREFRNLLGETRADLRRLVWPSSRRA